MSESAKDIIRFYHEDLQGLKNSGRKCEKCSLDMNIHKWAELNADGFVIRCSVKGVVSNV